jgi:hypothetical protein
VRNCLSADVGQYDRLALRHDAPRNQCVAPLPSYSWQRKSKADRQEGLTEDSSARNGYDGAACRNCLSVIRAQTTLRRWRLRNGSRPTVGRNSSLISPPTGIRALVQVIAGRTRSRGPTGAAKRCSACSHQNGATPSTVAPSCRSRRTLASACLASWSRNSPLRACHRQSWLSGSSAICCMESLGPSFGCRLTELHHPAR